MLNNNSSIIPFQTRDKKVKEVVAVAALLHAAFSKHHICLLDFKMWFLTVPCLGNALDNITNAPVYYYASFKYF